MFRDITVPLNCYKCYNGLLSTLNLLIQNAKQIQFEMNLIKDNVVVYWFLMQWLNFLQYFLSLFQLIQTTLLSTFTYINIECRND